MTQKGVVIVGAGQGGFQMAASLRQDKYKGAITLIGDELGLPYQRPPLSKAYLKDGNADRLALRPDSFYERNDITLLDNTRVVAIDRALKSIETSTGARYEYDHLVLATGTRNAVPPIKNLDLDGVHVMRTLTDAGAVREALPDASHAIVVGGGFIGLEFAAVARASGLQVTVVEGADRLMARAVSPAISTVFQDAHNAVGTQLVLNQFVTDILDDGQGRVQGIKLADGREVAGDMVLVAAGVVPNISLAQDAGLGTDNGIVVDRYLCTNDPAISALGDCAAFPDPVSGRSIRLESVQAATDHARTISKRLLGTATAYAAVPWFWSDQGLLKLQIAGLTTGTDEQVIRIDEGKTAVFCFKDGILLGVETVNAPAYHMSGRKVLAQAGKVSKKDLENAGYDLKSLL